MNTTFVQNNFEKNFGHPCRLLFSAPGRTELGGNHTDHQHGLVLAAAVSMETTAAVAENSLGCIRVFSEGYPEFSVDLSDLAVRPEERGTSAALVRGIAAAFARRGITPVGFDAAVTSTVLPGGGLSSSASFEVLIGTVLNHLTGAGIPAPEIARIGQFAENEYYGKPSGLMDQTACACGGVLSIDFADTDAPVITKLDVDFRNFGYQLFIIDSGADHSGLTEEYAAVPAELKKISAFFGKNWLREVPEEDFYANFRTLEALAGDRAMLRAMHVYEDNRRVREQLAALQAGDIETYLRAVKASGDSSWKYLQNVIPAGSTFHQEMALTLALTEKLLDGRGACRVHGGGFAGAIQAYVPLDRVDDFTQKLGAIIGPEKIRSLAVRAEGGRLEAG